VEILHQKGEVISSRTSNISTQSPSDPRSNWQKVEVLEIVEIFSADPVKDAFESHAL
jgi:hypothetical protein